MFVNAWLINPLDEQGDEFPGEYPSGGPVSKMLDIWRAAAPSIDLLAPDIYASDFKTVCQKYTRSGNPLLIPEAKREYEPERKVFYAIAEHDAICFATFGIDNKDFPADHPLAQSYKLLSDLMPLIHKYHGTENMRGFLEYDEDKTIVDIGNYRFNIDFDLKNKKGSGCGLIIATASNEFLIAGLDFLVTFKSNNKDLPHAGVLSIEEGRYENRKWVPRRVLNGDETGHGTKLGFSSELVSNGSPICKIRLYTFK